MAQDIPPQTTDYRENLYHRVSPAMDYVGNSFFDLEFSDAQRAYWDEVMRVMFHLDDILDQDKPKDIRFSEYDQALDVITTGERDDSLPDAVNDLLLQFRQTTINLDPTLLETARKNAHTIALLGERMRETKSPKILAATILAEGRVTGRIAGANPNGVTSGDLTKFSQYVEQATGTADLMDTIIDLKKDSKEGLLALDPSLRHRVELIGRVLPGILKSLKPLDAAMIFGLFMDIPQIIADTKKSKTDLN